MVRLWSAALDGVSGVPIEVEVRISSQLPRVDVVGLPEATVRESVSRIRGAIAAAGLNFPDRRVTVNLAPADLRKSGAALDLAIALGVLAANGSIDPAQLAGRAFLGELALDGRLRASRGTLASLLAAREVGVEEAIVPAASAARASLAPGLRICGAPDLAAVLAHLDRRQVIPPTPTPPLHPNGMVGLAEGAGECLSDIRGQSQAKRALEVAAAGGHGLLMLGPPGTGKTLLAQRLRGLLPPPDERERLEALSVHDAAGLLGADHGLDSRRPFRAPHHSASSAGLLGGGQPIRPGEVSLAHQGVLFLDELPEFDRRCLESLREVLEQGIVRIARAGQRCELPARFQLIAAANPCPCGDFGRRGRDCRCDDAVLARYRQRLSGPLLDRIDLHVTVGEVPWPILNGPATGPTSAEVRERVARARRRQLERGGCANAAIPDGQLEAIVRAKPDGLALLGRAVERWHLSARATRCLLRVARTLADLAGHDATGAEAIAEALEMRVGG
jgi:magnesium chelatase family protein